MCGDLALSLRPGNDPATVRLMSATYVPKLRYHLFSLTALKKNGHFLYGSPEGITAKLISKRSIFVPLLGHLSTMYTRRTLVDSRGEYACAGIAPEPPSAGTTFDFSDFRCIFGHSHELMPRKTAQLMGGTLSGSLHERKSDALRRRVSERLSNGLPTPKQLRNLERLHKTLVGRRWFNPLGSEGTHSLCGTATHGSRGYIFIRHK